MVYIKRHKEVILLIIAVFIFFIAVFHLLKKQEKRSQAISSGAIILPTAAQCEVPKPDLVKRAKDTLDLNDIQEQIKADNLNMDNSLFKTKAH